jgi:hypothetical protein
MSKAYTTEYPHTHTWVGHDLGHPVGWTPRGTRDECALCDAVRYVAPDGTATIELTPQKVDINALSAALFQSLAACDDQTPFNVAGYALHCVAAWAHRQLTFEDYADWLTQMRRLVDPALGCLADCGICPRCVDAALRCGDPLAIDPTSPTGYSRLTEPTGVQAAARTRAREHYAGREPALRALYLQRVREIYSTRLELDGELS